MCFRVDTTYKCGHTETLLKPYASAGYPQCRRVQRGQTLPGHVHSTDTRRSQKDTLNDCIACSYISGERWAPRSCAADSDIVMLDTYLRTESFRTRNPAIHKWVIEAVDMDWVTVAGGAEFEMRDAAVGAAVKRVELETEREIEDVALREIGEESRTDRNSQELDDVIVEIKFTRYEGPGSEYRLQQSDDKAEI